MSEAANPKPHQTSSERRIFGFQVTPIGARELTSLIAGKPRQKGRGVGLVITPNIDHIVKLRTDLELRSAYNGAEIIVCDGFPVYYYAIFRGLSVPSRVTGYEIAELLMSEPKMDQLHRLFFVVDTDDTREGVLRWSERVKVSTPAVEVAPTGFGADPDYCRELARRISEHGTTILFMGVGAPRSEIFVNSYREHLPDCWALCVGQAVRVQAGLARRAPPLLQALHLEWFYRLAKEPRRLSRRYLVSSLLFLASVWEDLTGKAAGGTKRRDG
jgi:N-acetylglucosaminyldiphosphoundecaprenol N-acetyl-beta-D-mannosaminyltransferase